MEYDKATEWKERYCNYYTLQNTKYINKWYSYKQSITKQSKKTNKTAATHREELLKEFSDFIRKQSNCEIIIAGDFNESITSKRIEQFLVENRLFDIYEFINSEYAGRKNYTYKRGSNQIDVVASTLGVVLCIRGSEMINFY